MDKIRHNQADIDQKLVTSETIEIPLQIVQGERLASPVGINNIKPFWFQGEMSRPASRNVRLDGTSPEGTTRFITVRPEVLVTQRDLVMPVLVFTLPYVNVQFVMPAMSTYSPLAQVAYKKPFFKHPALVYFKDQGLLPVSYKEIPFCPTTAHFVVDKQINERVLTGVVQSLYAKSPGRYEMSVSSASNHTLYKGEPFRQFEICYTDDPKTAVKIGRTQ